MTASTQKGKHPDKDRTKLHIFFGIIIAVFVIAVILLGHGFFEKNGNVAAATIGDKTFEVTDVEYYYYQVYNSTYNMSKMYASYGMQGGYDISKSPDEQMYDAQAGKTYADYFRETALNQLQQVTILNDEAKKANYTLSAEGKASVASQMKQIDTSLLQYSVKYGGKEAYYLKMMYGQNMTKSLLKDLITKATLAEEYATKRSNEFTYDKEALNNYYGEHTADLDSYDYRFCLIAADPKTEVDAEGKKAEPTEEQTAAAMEVARQAAEAMASRVRSGKDFNTVAKDYADEATKEKFSDPEYNHTIDSLGSSLTSVYGEWLKDTKRKANDVGVVKEDGSGYYVVQFLNRERRENSYQTVDVNSILIQSETTSSQDDKGNPVEKPTQDQLAAAHKKAEDILAQYNNTADKSSDAFLALASKDAKAGEPKSEVLSKVSRNTYGADFDKWAFTPGTASLGSTTIVDATDSSGNVIGYRIMYLNAMGQIRWEYGAESALRNADYEKWYTSMKEQYPITQKDGMKLVNVNSKT